MSTANVLTLPTKAVPRPVELGINDDMLDCLVRLTLEEARTTLALISHWPEQQPFRFQGSGLMLDIPLSPEGAAVWVDELTLQLNHFS